MAAKIGEILHRHEIKYSVYNEIWPDVITGFTDAWIIGGDGTINFFINKYPDIQLPLAVFAGGSGNDFHWMLYGKITVEQQVEKILKLTGKKVDAGMCNGKLFLNGIGLGFDGAIIRDLMRKKKKLPGKTSYMLSILKNLLRFKEFGCSINYNNRQVNEKVFMVCITNSKRVGGGYKVTPLAEVNDGLLDLNIVTKISFAERIRYLPVIEKGKHLNLKFIKYSQTPRVIINTEAEIGGQRDGEYISGNYFEIECLPAKFTFLY